MAAFRWLCGLLIAVAIGVSATASAQAPHRNPVQPAPVPTPQGATTIAAVVNDEVISVFDLISRIRIVLISSNAQDTPENRQRLAKQVLNQLVDEKLELQEAKKKNVTAGDAEVEEAVQMIEKQNNMKPGQLNEFLKAQGIDRGSLVDQITASIVWGKLVRRMAAETTEISDDEIDQATNRAKEHANDPETRVAEIFLPVDNPSQEATVRATADGLIEQMRKGARFSSVAQQYSQSATAAVGGDLGWVQTNQLSPELSKAVTNMKAGELSPPIRTGAGFYVLLVLDRRNGSSGSEQDTVYDVVQVVFPLPASPNEAQKRAAVIGVEGVRSGAKNCADFLRLGKEKVPQFSSEGHLRSNQISPDMRKLIDHLSVGQASQPILQKNGVGVVMLCGKTAADAQGPITRNTVLEAIAKQRYDQISRRYLTDLRRAAYVDIRN